MAPTLDHFTLTAWALAFLAALGGSLHCAAMCGPLRLIIGEDKKARALYQAGRLLGYLILGFLAGSLGLALPAWIWLPILAIAILFSLYEAKVFPAWKRWRSQIMQMASANPGLLGLVSALLPCGMLHAWVAAAGATRSPLLGAVLLATLWLGTLPALEASSLLLGKLLRPLRIRFPRLLPILLVLLAILPLWLRLHHDHSKNHGSTPPGEHHHGSPH